MRASVAVESYLRGLPRRGASRSTIRQRRWALEQAVTAAALRRLLGPDPDPAAAATVPLPAFTRALAQVELSELLDPTFAEWFLPWAGTGALSARSGGARTAGTSQAAHRARVAALRALATSQGKRAPTTSPAPPPLRELLPPAEVHAAITTLAAGWGRPGAPDAAVRARLAAVLVATELLALRSAQLCALEVTAVGPGAAELIPASGPAVPVPSSWRSVLLDWLACRDELVGPLEGSARALWVSVHPNHDATTGARRPPGLPLQPRGLQRSYARAAADANVRHAGLAGFPLPRSFDLLRRSAAARAPGRADGAGGAPSQAG